VNLLSLSQRVIRLSFYGLFVLIPLLFTPWNSELFELSKMWTAFVLTTIIAASWAVKSIVSRKFYIQRTPLDVPIALFLLSQFVSTVISLDNHVSIWGYYSRFNGGLLSTISYIFLYYAFLSNFGKEELVRLVRKILMLSVVTGLIVALWGLPSHFGYDPTCLLFRGELNVSCWTEDFQPKARIFSTLGQPAWLGAYLAVLIPISFAFALKKIDFGSANKLVKLFWKPMVLILISLLFYADLLYTRARASFFGIWGGLLFLTLWSGLSGSEGARLLDRRGDLMSSIWFLFRKGFKEYDSKILVGLTGAFLVITFLIGAPFSQLRFFSLDGIRNQAETADQSKGTFSTGGGTESGKIRLYVWQGALDIFRNNPLFGTGVETFAFAYYKYRPVEHNLTSEWNFLYNKAHNEYLNYLATTGIFGLGSYLFLIGLFLWQAVRYVLFVRKDFLIAALIASYVSILVTNFFGFSVVIINLYFFLIPAFVFVLANLVDFRKTSQVSINLGSKARKGALILVFITGFYILFFLFKYWTADILYAMGSNLSRAGEHQQAYSYLKTAAERMPTEPTYRDELAETSATLAIAFANEGSTEAAQLAQQLAEDAVLTTTSITQDHPNNLVFLKTQVRIFYNLSQADPRYLPLAIATVEKAQKLAPTDANISYNLGILHGQNKDYKKAIEILEKTIKLKPNYTSAYYALGLFYHQMATNERDQVIDVELQQKAIEQMEFILNKLDPKNQLAKEALETWKQELPSPSR
jgi:putative inorganic carbon (hco3(-)) transporter